MLCFACCSHASRSHSTLHLRGAAGQLHARTLREGDVDGRRFVALSHRWQVGPPTHAACASRLSSARHARQAAEQPDPSGAQLRQLKRFLRQQPALEYVWSAAAPSRDTRRRRRRHDRPWHVATRALPLRYDYSCMPLRAHTAAEQALRDESLRGLELLFRCATVVVLRAKGELAPESGDSAVDATAAGESSAEAVRGDSARIAALETVLDAIS